MNASFRIDFGSDRNVWILLVHGQSMFGGRKTNTCAAEKKKNETDLLIASADQ